jgi:hypothetical protein
MKKKILVLIVLFLLAVPYIISIQSITHQSERPPGIKVLSKSDNVDSRNILIYGNFTLSNHNINLSKNYILDFVSNSSQYFFIDSNVNFSHVVIESTYSSLIIQNERSVTLINFCYSDLFFNGAMELDNSTIAFRNSSLGKQNELIRTTFLNDKITSLNSTFHSVKESVQSLYNVSSLNQGKQPISTGGNFEFNYYRTPYYAFPISEIKWKMNYSLKGINSKVELNFSIDNNTSLLNATVESNHTCGIVTSYLLRPSFFRNVYNSTILVHISYPYGLNLTLWKDSVCFISNSTLNFTGLTHNFIILNDTIWKSYNSTFLGNGDPYDINGYLNSHKLGIFLEDQSTLILVSSSFSRNNDMEISPVINSGKSRFYNFIGLNIYFEMYNKTYSYTGQDLTFTNNESIKEIYASQLIKARTLLNEFNILPVYCKNGSIEKTNSIFSFKIFNLTEYISVNRSQLFSLSSVNYSINFSNVSSIRSNINYTFTQNNILIHDAIINNLKVSSILRGNLSAYYSNTFQNRSFSFQTGGNTRENYLNYTIMRKPSFNASCLKTEINIHFFNGIKNVTFQISASKLLGPYFHNYTILSRGLPVTQSFSIIYNYHKYTSNQGRIHIKGLKSSLVIYTTNSGYYKPRNTTVTIFSGINYLNFTKIRGELIIINRLNLPINITIASRTYSISKEINVSLAFGNYTIEISHNGVNKYQSLIVKSNHTVLYINYVTKTVNSNPYVDVFFLLIPPITAVSTFQLARFKFVRICPACLKIVKIGENHTHKKSKH